jgi:hypothetical protein
MTPDAEAAVPDAKAKSDAARTRLIVRLNITDFACPPEEITRLLGLTPGKTWRQGELVHPRAKHRHRQNGWRLDAPGDENGTDLDERVSALMDQITPRADRFASLPPGSEVELSCVIYISVPSPVLGLSARNVKRLAELGAHLDLDVYDLRADG